MTNATNTWLAQLRTLCHDLDIEGIMSHIAAAPGSSVRLLGLEYVQCHPGIVCGLPYYWDFPAIVQIQWDRAYMNLGGQYDHSAPFGYKKLREHSVWGKLPRGRFPPGFPSAALALSESLEARSDMNAGVGTVIPIRVWRTWGVGWLHFAARYELHAIGPTADRHVGVGVYAELEAADFNDWFPRPPPIPPKLDGIPQQLYTTLRRRT